MASRRIILSSATRIIGHAASQAPRSIRAEAASLVNPYPSPRRKVIGPRIAWARSYSQSNEYHEVSASGSKIWNFEQIQKLVKDGSKGVVVIDAREPNELEQTGRIPGAINIPISTAPESFHIRPEEFKERYGFERPSKDTEIVMYCKAGVRSRAAAAIARQAGFTNVGEYPGSWLDWEKNTSNTGKQS